LTSLLILVGTAAAAFLRLWLKHRRVVRNDYTDIDSHGASLRKLSGGPGQATVSDWRRPRSDRPVNHLRLTSHPSSLDPPRREAALRRIEARRRGEAG
jgi:hypothetical protein